MTEERTQKQPQLKGQQRKQKKASKPPKSDHPYIDKYCINLTESVAKEIEDFEVFGREDEVQKLWMALLRDKKNSPVLVGDAGVGKTAIVEGLCADIVRGRVPKRFKNRNFKVYSLDVASISTVGERGEKPINILKHVVSELEDHKKDIILFVDEVHTIMGAGTDGEKSSADIGNTLKPALSRGTINMVSATTEEEFRIIEKDPAMERRFIAIRVEEPSIEDAVRIMSKIAPRYKRKYGIEVLPEAIRASVELSVRYVGDKHLPDKAIDLMENAVAHALFADREEVTSHDVAKIISEDKNIPLDIITRISNKEPINFYKELSKVVKGQERVIRDIAKKLPKTLVDMQDVKKVSLALFLLGTSGTGKTEIAKQVARLVFGTEEAMIRIDMNTYQDKLATHRIIGTKEEPGELTDRVKRKPYSLILLDEIEKAHPDVHNLLLQMLDDGYIVDGRGRKIDFKNTIIIATSNAGHRRIMDKYASTGNTGFETLSKAEYNDFLSNVTHDLEHIFRPEFLNRWDYIGVMNMLGRSVAEAIVSNRLALREAEWYKKHNITLKYFNSEHVEDKQGFIEFLKNVGVSEKNGARPLNRAIEDNLGDELGYCIYNIRNRNNSDKYIAEVTLLGEPPRTTKQGGLDRGRQTVYDMRYTTIELKRITTTDAS